VVRLAGWSPLSFFRDTQEATVMAFSTASSNATLPTALRVADQMGLPQRVSRFVLTVGATANQNGTALFEGVTVIFLAQFFGVDLSIGQQFMVMAVCILGGIGTAGVPSGSLPVVAMICAMVGVNPLGIGLILGVNHFLDMCRTALNVTGDLALTTLVAKGERTTARRWARAGLSQRHCWRPDRGRIPFRREGLRPHESVCRGTDPRPATMGQ
jgi:DAACS family dicarboxylate/amino acid:cation (Na+ or H+) symporter